VESRTEEPRTEEPMDRSSIMNSSETEVALDMTGLSATKTGERVAVGGKSATSRPLSSTAVAKKASPAFPIIISKPDLTSFTVISTALPVLLQKEKGGKNTMLIFFSPLA
jgi:hypothetical protein